MLTPLFLDVRLGSRFAVLLGLLMVLFFGLLVASRSMADCSSGHQDADDCEDESIEEIVVVGEREDDDDDFDELWEEDEEYWEDEEEGDGGDDSGSTPVPEIVPNIIVVAQRPLPPHQLLHGAGHFYVERAHIGLQLLETTEMTDEEILNQCTSAVRAAAFLATWWGPGLALRAAQNGWKLTKVAVDAYNRSKGAFETKLTFTERGAAGAAVVYITEMADIPETVCNALGISGE